MRGVSADVLECYEQMERRLSARVDSVWVPDDIKEDTLAAIGQPFFSPYVIQQHDAATDTEMKLRLKVVKVLRIHLLRTVSVPSMIELLYESVGEEEVDGVLERVDFWL
ncbi:hypothetical protein LTR09_012648 [Extremus antarcticus]|uniref:Uncharacterized protein n=1 Tax=Extremus antarcticus TaxID=702011 RepID=A0AAJ0D9J0_9PEZI|nr:hypothetical protein LTR09_012648 [Extremus antarcticus]